MSLVNSAVGGQALRCLELFTANDTVEHFVVVRRVRPAVHVQRAPVLAALPARAAAVFAAMNIHVRAAGVCGRELPAADRAPVALRGAVALFVDRQMAVRRKPPEANRTFVRPFSRVDSRVNFQALLVRKLFTADDAGERLLRATGMLADVFSQTFAPRKLLLAKHAEKRLRFAVRVFVDRQVVLSRKSLVAHGTNVRLGCVMVRTIGDITAFRQHCRFTEHVEM